ncbi:MAG TPA: Hpt domain-containing protein [Rhodanobacteraceae bacterium]|nr:Hpt domain-containing protein [Rhodanobacteraceae bacterium]
MNADDDIQFTTLSWVKHELDETLRQAREALEAYVDDPGDAGQMRRCADHLHQVHGTLRMVELYGAAMLVEEMEKLADALQGNTIHDRNEAYGVLMRGMVQIPDYLERVQGGHRDIPVVLLPLLNDLRAARGERGVSEAVLFAPNLSAELPADAPGAMQPLSADAQRAEIKRLRDRFQIPLLAWMRNAQDRASLATMRGLLDQLGAVCHSVTGRRLWWITGGVLEGIEAGQLDGELKDIKPLIARVDRAVKQLMDGGEMALTRGDAEDLARQLLYYVAHAQGSSSRLDALRRTYKLEQALPDEQEVEHARGAMSGHNRALLDTVSVAIKDDLLRVKDALDIFLRQSHADPAELAPQVEVLDRVGDTLGMLGLAVPRRVIDEQRLAVQSIVDGSQAHDESTLLDVAGALLYVESSLDDHIEHLGAEGQHEAGDNAPLSAESRRVLDALMGEAAVNLGRVKHDITAFIETPWNHAEVEQIPQLLEEIGGAMRMLDVQRPADLLNGISRFVNNELIVDRRVPTAEQMDKLADALASIEYYLEASRENRAGRERILDVTQQSLAAMGYWPVPPKREPEAVPEPVAAPAPAPAPLPPVANSPPPTAETIELSEPVAIAPGTGLEDLIVGGSEPVPVPEHDMAGLNLAETLATATPDDDWIEVEEEIEEEVPVESGESGAGFQAVSDEIDEDIREVFVEEFQDEIAGLGNAMAEWKADTGNLELLKPIRRSFHTLKGSGRLVGALGVGEFSWKVENMLNRVLDKTIQPSDHVVALVDHAVAALPVLLAGLRGETAGSAPVTAIMQTADKLAAGEAARVEDLAPAATRKVKRTVVRRIPRPRTEETEIPAAQFTDPVVSAEVEASTPAIIGSDALPAPALPPIDPVLQEILRSEVAQHVGVMRDFSANERAYAPATVSETLLRAVHTLSGAVAMVDIPVLVHVLAPLENYFKRLRAHDVALPVEGFDTLDAVSTLVEEVMAQFDVAAPVLPDSTALAAQVVALRDTLPEPAMAHPIFGPVEPLDDDELALEGETEEGMPQEIEAVSIAGDPDAGATPPVDAADDTHWLAAEIAAAASELPNRDADDYLGAEAAFAGSAPGPALTDEAIDFHATVDPHAHDIAAARDAAAAEAARLETARQDAERAEAERADAERAEAERADAERAEAERADAERADAERADAERADAERADAERAEAERAEAERAEAERADAERADAERADAERIAALRQQEHLDLLRFENERLERERVAAERAEIEHKATESAATVPTETPRAAGRASSLFADSQPDGPLDVPDLDQDLLEIFVQEASDILDSADSTMARLRESPADTKLVSELQRDLHTLKGGARMAGLAPIGDLGHTMESLFEVIAEGKRKADPAVIEALELGFDSLHRLVQRVAHGRAVAIPVNAIDHFKALIAGKTPVAEAPAVVAPSPQKPAEPVAAPAAHIAPAVAAPSRAAPAEEFHAAQEMIRVRSDLLDSLVNYAGEVSIYRSRLEQQVATFRFNLIEFDQTVTRLRDQLRQLEIETEAQIIARYQREQQEIGASTFDPLELDRFSQLQQYSRALAESVSDLVSIQGLLDDLTRQSETLLLQQSRVSSDLQEGLMRTRMVPFDSMVPSLRRTLRQAAQETGKRAQMRIEGAQGEMDRNLLERMKAPFEHMLRNAMAHGIESPADRRTAGKPDEGMVRIAVSRDATEVVIRVSDDGRGINRDAVRAKAIERGLMKAEANLSDRDIFAFMLETGFSTANEVTQLAGRGVGMDVVASEIKQLGGTLAIDSQAGKGATFTIRLPFTLAVTQAILVRIGDHVFAVPMTSVAGVVRIARDDLQRRLADPDGSYVYAGDSAELHDLAGLLGLNVTHAADEAQVPMLMTRTGDQRAAVRIDSVVGSREIVVKSVGPQVSSVPGIFGATIMGDGSVVMILDLAPLVRRHVALRERSEETGVPMAAPEPVAEVETRNRPLVMVVDDSITMRKVTTRVLERNEMDVVTAKDGLDAVERLQETVPDLMLLDIEMPRMDGYELATYMRNDPRLKGVPIIMITSRTGEKHRQRAMELGVERYLGKPYQEAELLQNAHEVLQARRVDH